MSKMRFLAVVLLTMSVAACGLLPATATPRPLRTVVGEESRINIIVLGTDDASGRTSMNSDVMVLVSIDTESWTVSLISFPSDLYVYVPGRNMTRINTAFAYGGRDLVAQTLLYNFGLEVAYYARVNFASFVRAA